MKNLLATWDLPTAREEGGPLDPADISHVEASLNAGAGFSTPVLIAASDTQEWEVQDLDIGSYVLRLVVVLLDGKASAPVDTPFEVIDDSAPLGVVNVNITLS